MGKKKASGQPSRRKPSGQSSLAAQKKRILRSPDWITKGLAFCALHGPWHEWEQQLLKELSRGPSYDFDSAVMYSRDVLKRPWPDLEPLLVGLMPAPDLVRSLAAAPLISPSTRTKVTEAWIDNLHRGRMKDEGGRMNKEGAAES